MYVMYTQWSKDLLAHKSHWYTRVHADNPSHSYDTPVWRHHFVRMYRTYSHICPVRFVLVVPLRFSSIGSKQQAAVPCESRPISWPARAMHTDTIPTRNNIIWKIENVNQTFQSVNDATSNRTDVIVTPRFDSLFTINHMRGFCLFGAPKTAKGIRK